MNISKRTTENLFYIGNAFVDAATVIALVIAIVSVPVSIVIFLSDTVKFILGIIL